MIAVCVDVIPCLPILTFVDLQRKYQSRKDGLLFTFSENVQKLLCFNLLFLNVLLIGIEIWFNSVLPGWNRIFGLDVPTTIKLIRDLHFDLTVFIRLTIVRIGLNVEYILD